MTTADGTEREGTLTVTESASEHVVADRSGHYDYATSPCITVYASGTMTYSQHRDQQSAWSYGWSGTF